MNKLRKLQQLSTNEWWLLAQSQVLLPLTFCGVRVLTVSRWQDVLRELAKVGKTRFSGPHAEGCDSTRTFAIARMVSVAANHGIFRANCLQQSMVLWYLLEREGIESEICFGARKENRQFQAHAWVEVNGQTISYDEGVHQSFSSLGVCASSKIDNHLTEISPPRTI